MSRGCAKRSTDCYDTEGGEGRRCKIANKIILEDTYGYEDQVVFPDGFIMVECSRPGRVLLEYFGAGSPFDKRHSTLHYTLLGHHCERAKRRAGFESLRNGAFIVPSSNHQQASCACKRTRKRPALPSRQSTTTSTSAVLFPLYTCITAPISATASKTSGLSISGAYQGGVWKTQDTRNWFRFHTDTSLCQICGDFLGFE